MVCNNPFVAAFSNLFPNGIILNVIFYLIYKLILSCKGLHLIWNLKQIRKLLYKICKQKPSTGRYIKYPEAYSGCNIFIPGIYINVYFCKAIEFSCIIVVYAVT